MCGNVRSVEIIPKIITVQLPEEALHKYQRSKHEPETLRHGHASCCTCRCPAWRAIRPSYRRITPARRCRILADDIRELCFGRRRVVGLALQSRLGCLLVRVRERQKLALAESGPDESEAKGDAGGSLKGFVFSSCVSRRGVVRLEAEGDGH